MSPVQPGSGAASSGADNDSERRRRFAAELGESLARLRTALEDTERVLEQERMRADEAQQRVEEIYSSATWRVGNLILWIPKRFKALLRR